MSDGAIVRASLTTSKWAQLYGSLLVIGKYIRGEVTFRFRQNGMHIFVQDAGNTLVSHFFVDASKLKDPDRYTLAVAECHASMELNVIQSIIGGANAKDMLRIDFMQNEQQKDEYLRVELWNEKRRCTYKVALMTPDVVDMSFPQFGTTSPWTVELPSSDVHQALKQVSSAFNGSGSCVAAAHNNNNFLAYIAPKGDQVIFQSTGIETNVKYAISVTSCPTEYGNEVTYDPETIIKDAIRHITVLTFLRHSRISPKMRLVLKPGLPAVFSYLMDDLGAFTLYVAPNDCLNDDDKKSHRGLIDTTEESDLRQRVRATLQNGRP